RELNLSRISDSDSQKAIEVEQPRRRQRVDVVFVVERVEHLESGQQRDPIPKLDRPRESPIKRKVFVVLASCIAIIRRSCSRGDRLRGASLDSRIQLKAPADLRIVVEVEFVTDISIRQRIVER